MSRKNKQTVEQLDNSPEDQTTEATGSSPAATETEAVTSPVETTTVAETTSTEAPVETTSPEPEAAVEEPIVVTETIAPPVEAPAVEAVEEVDTSAMSEEEAYLAKAAQSGTPAQKKLLAALASFSETTLPGRPIVAKTFIGAQQDLWRVLNETVSLPFNEFKPTWNIFLVYFLLYQGDPRFALGERFCNRFPYAWTRGPEVLDCLMNLITLARLTRDPKNRVAKSKNIMLDKVGPSVLSPTALDNLKKFYSSN